jgi:hypothetical protein
MIQRRCELDLLEKPVGADHRGQVRTQDLEGDPALVLEVPGQEDRGHATPPELPLDFVLAFETGSEKLDQLWHGPMTWIGEYGRFTGNIGGRGPSGDGRSRARRSYCPRIAFIA